MRLYHYVHCPFCVRVRMVLGLLNIPYESKVLPYDDEQTPIDLMGIKMLPIFSWAENDVSNESLDIIKRLDKDNILKNEIVTTESFNKVETLLDEIGKDVHNLCMPYWIWTPEFNEKSRKYFQTKKEKKRGPFNLLMHNKKQFITGLNQTLAEVEKDITTFYQSDELTINDICIAAHLWGMYIFPEFQFTEKMHNYLQRVKDLCVFDYHKDFWQTNNGVSYE